MKSDFRTQMQSLRDGIPADTRAQKSQAICRILSALVRQRKLRRVAAFWPYRSEVDLRPLFEAHPETVWFFPRIATTRPPRLMWGAEPLEPGMYGLMEPVLAQHPTPPVEILLVPGLAFDGDGYRLGYGGGFYDALLAHLPEGVTALAVGFGCQRVEEVPREPMDHPVDGLCTEGGLAWFSPKA